MTSNTTTNEKESQGSQENSIKEDNSQQRRSSNSSTNTLSSFGNSTNDSFGNSTKGLVVKTLKYSDGQLAPTKTTKSFIPNLLLGSNVSKINPTSKNDNIPQNLHPSLVLDNKWKTNKESPGGEPCEKKSSKKWVS